jgi:hypothetical protein
VDHPCYRCQAEIPEGVAFCPHCGAPQIRVAAPEGESPVPPPATSDYQGTTSPSQPSFQAPYGWTDSSASYPPQSVSIRWELAWKGALLSGVGAAILSAIPFVSLGCCVWMLGAGALAVALYRTRVPGTLVTPGMGMKIGALAGLFGFGVNAGVSMTSFFALRTNGNFRHAMEEQMQKQMASNPDPKVQEMVQRLLDWMSTPQGAVTLVAIMLVIMAIVFVLFTAAGGALGASIMGRRRQFR